MGPFVGKNLAYMRFDENNRDSFKLLMVSPQLENGNFSLKQRLKKHALERSGICIQFCSSAKRISHMSSCFIVRVFLFIQPEQLNGLQITIINGLRALEFNTQIVKMESIEVIMTIYNDNLLIE